MTLWLDAHLSPKLVEPLSEITGVDVVSIYTLNLALGKDSIIFELARASGAVIVTKDANFAEMVARIGSPLQIIWLRVGNRSNHEMLKLLKRSLWLAMDAIRQGESIVEVREEIPT